MKLIRYILIITGLWNCNAFSQNLTISHLTGDFYVYTTYNDIDGKPFPSNGLYLVTDEGVVIIDTPWDTSQFQPLLDSIQKRHHKKAILSISTHYHADRTAGLEYFQSKGISTYSSALTKKLCKKHHEKQAAFTFKKDTIFNIGGYKIETFYPGKGHTKDNIVIWFEHEKILYGGCFLKSSESRGLGNLANADVKAWPKSLQRVIAKFPFPKYSIPGHQQWDGNKSLIHTLDLLLKK